MTNKVVAADKLLVYRDSNETDLLISPRLLMAFDTCIELTYQSSNLLINIRKISVHCPTVSVSRLPK